VEVSPGQATSWDGWKVLLDRLDLDFELPKPKKNSDPNYKPAPPRASLDSVSVEGKVIVTFSKPVFQLKEMTSKMIGRRVLAKPFLDIQIEPGEMSDPSLLTFQANV